MKERPNPMDLPSLTESQFLVYSYIEQHIKNNEIPPTLEEVAIHMKEINHPPRVKSAVHIVVNKLVEMGYLDRGPKKQARTIVPLVNSSEIRRK